MKKLMTTVCKCPKCQALVVTENKNEFEDRTCNSCGTVFRKEIRYKWVIKKEGGA